MLTFPENSLKTDGVVPPTGSFPPLRNIGFGAAPPEY